jgi:DNA-binding NtrC family response regulator
VLEKSKWNLSETARILGITRVTLYNKIDKYGLRSKETAKRDAAAEPEGLEPSGP